MCVFDTLPNSQELGDIDWLVARPTLAYPNSQRCRRIMVEWKLDEVGVAVLIDRPTISGSTEVGEKRRIKDYGCQESKAAWNEDEIQVCTMQTIGYY